MDEKSILGELSTAKNKEVMDTDHDVLVTIQTVWSIKFILKENKQKIFAQNEFIQ